MLLKFVNGLLGEWHSCLWMKGPAQSEWLCCVASYWSQWHPRSAVPLPYGLPRPRAHAINSDCCSCISTVHSVKPLWSVPEVPFCSLLLWKALSLFSASLDCVDLHWSNWAAQYTLFLVHFQAQHLTLIFALNNRGMFCNLQTFPHPHESPKSHWSQHSIGLCRVAVIKKGWVWVSTITINTPETCLSSQDTIFWNVTLKSFYMKSNCLTSDHFL